VSHDGDIADYLLGELGQGDRERVERRMRDDAAFRAEVERMRPVVAKLEALPPGAWEQGDVPPLPALPPLPPAAATSRSRARRAWLRPSVAIAACVALVAIGVAIGGLSFGGGDDGGGATIELARLGEAAPSAHGVAHVASRGDGELRLDVSGMRPSEPRQLYTIWLLDGPERAVALGSFRVPSSGATEVTVPLPVSLTDFRYIDVSVEPEDGDPAHSGRSVLRAGTTT
jgi:anti-sigma-K factor RskA